MIIGVSQKQACDCYELRVPVEHYQELAVAIQIQDLGAYHGVRTLVNHVVKPVINAPGRGKTQRKEPHSLGKKHMH